LLGEAVYDGAMDGWAFIGSLPERFQLVLMLTKRYNRDHIAWSLRFLHRETGIVLAEDARLVDTELPWDGEEMDIQRVNFSMIRLGREQFMIQSLQQSS